MLERVDLNFFNLQKMLVIVFMICFSAVALIYFNEYRVKSRDVKRRADLSMLITALELYQNKHGVYPQSVDDYRGWDLSYASSDKPADFLPVLKEEKFIDREVMDPVNNDRYFYRYQAFPAGSYGCAKSFYILQIVNFETEQTSGNGMGKCDNYDWGKLAPYGYTTQGYD
jgi:hypothetical protein